jgi:hypothetical protein
MNSMHYVKALGVWSGFLAVAVAGGIMRERFLVPGLGPLAGRAFETLLVTGMIFGLIYVYVGKLTGATSVALFKLGLFWTVLTLAFECLFGRLVMGLSWESLGADYNVFQGRLWLLVLLVTWFGPLFAKKIREYFHVRQPA